MFGRLLKNERPEKSAANPNWDRDLPRNSQKGPSFESFLTLPLLYLDEWIE
jgi:hypothetical protein